MKPWEEYQNQAATPSSPIDTALSAEGISGPKADFVKSIYQQESGSGRNTKTSNAGAVGGMQIIPATFNRMADKGWSIDNPDQNTRAGVRYASLVYDKAGGDPALAGAGYYGGEGAIAKARNGIAVSDPRNPKAPNTLQYGQKVASRIQSSGVKPWEEYQAAAAPQTAAPVPLSERPTTFGMDNGKLAAVGQGIGDTIAGAVRGAGSIGATLLSPIDAAARALGVQNSWVGRTDRRAAMDAGLKDMGANPDAALYQGGKIGAEIAGTAGAGGLLAKGATMIPGVAARSPALVNAIRSSGMTTGAPAGNTVAAKLANLGIRSAGGATTGAASAGMVNSDNTGSGAMIGGVLPGALALSGYGTNAIGKMVSGPGVSQSVTDGAKAAQQAGLVIPPTQVKPTLGNRLMEGIAGKISTAQNASAKNTPVINDMVAAEIGLPKGTQITPDVLGGIRKKAGDAYEAVKSTGTITPGPEYTQALDKITESARRSAAGFPNAKPDPLIAEIESLKSPQFDAGSAVSKISDLREAVDVAYRAGNKGLGKGLKAAADTLENTIDTHLTQIGAPANLLTGFRDARQLIAKTYSVEKALNPTTGTINAQKLAAQLDKGKPLSGGIRAAGQFAQQFPKAAQPLEKMGSLPQLSPLDWAASGAVSAGTANPLMLASVMARPAMRKLALSPAVQNRLANISRSNPLTGLLAGPDATQLLYRFAPQQANR